MLLILHIESIFKKDTSSFKKDERAHVVFLNECYKYLLEDALINKVPINQNDRKTVGIRCFIVFYRVMRTPGSLTKLRWFVLTRGVKEDHRKVGQFLPRKSVLGVIKQEPTQNQFGLIFASAPVCVIQSQA